MHRNHQNPQDKFWRDQHVHPKHLARWSAAKGSPTHHFACKYQIKQRRQHDRLAIKHQNWEAMYYLDEPRDYWVWD